MNSSVVNPTMDLEWGWVQPFISGKTGLFFTTPHPPHSL